MGTSSSEIVSLHGKTAIVTGSNIGLGRETALALAKRGASVVMACRNIDRAMEAAAYVRQVEPGAKVEPMLLDLKSPESIHQFVRAFKSSNKALHILVNNAGANFGKKPKMLSNGVSICTQVNFLGPYTLTRLLKDELVAAAPSRVVNVSSSMHRLGSIPDVDSYMRNGLYRNSKLANVMFTNEIQRRWQGEGVQSAAVDPGAVFSNIWRASIVSRPPVSWIFKTIFSPPSDGAASIVHAACGPWPPKHTPDDRGRFFARGFLTSYPVTSLAPTIPWLQGSLIVIACLGDWPLRNLSGGRMASKIKDVPTNPEARDSAKCRALWDAAEKLSGLA